MRRFIKIFKKPFSYKSLALVFCILLVSCSPASDNSSNGSSFTSLTDCENLYKSVFINTYYNFITTGGRTCNNCHSSPSTSHEITIADSNVAFQNFLLISTNPAGFNRARDARITLKATIIDDSHHSSGSSAFTATINSYESQWTDVQPIYDACVSSF